jgi:hypothetical protein
MALRGRAVAESRRRDGAITRRAHPDALDVAHDRIGGKLAGPGALMLPEERRCADDVETRNVPTDGTTPAGKLQMHILGAIAEFERERIRERVMAALQRARAQGKHLGRPRRRPAPLVAAAGLTVRQAAVLWGVSKSTAARRMAAGQVPDHTVSASA